MTTLADKLTRASDDFKRLNSHLFPEDAPRTPDAPKPDATLKLVLNGQVRGGKNNMGVTKTGRHYPKKPWKLWRDDAVAQVASQLSLRFIAFTVPCEVQLRYYAGDHRKRDQPAIIDALWHVLEKAGVVQDDTLLWVTGGFRSYDKKNPRVELEITPL